MVIAWCWKTAGCLEKIRLVGTTFLRLVQTRAAVCVTAWSTQTSASAYEITRVLDCVVWATWATRASWTPPSRLAWAGFLSVKSARKSAVYTQQDFKAVTLCTDCNYVHLFNIAQNITIFVIYLKILCGGDWGDPDHDVDLEILCVYVLRLTYIYWCNCEWLKWWYSATSITSYQLKVYLCVHIYDANESSVEVYGFLVFLANCWITW